METKEDIFSFFSYFITYYTVIPMQKDISKW